MKNKKNRGFTLIELLGVLVILAILSIITIPIVIKVINSSSKQATKRSIEGYAHAVENDISEWGMLHPGKSYSAYSISSNITKGQTVKCDNPSIYKNGTFNLGCCYTDDSKDKGEYYNYVNGKVEESTSCDTVNQTFNVLTTVTYANADYIVIGGTESTSDYVTLLKKEPLTYSEVIQYAANHKDATNEDILVMNNGVVSQNTDGAVQYYVNTKCKDTSDIFGEENNCNLSYSSSIPYMIINDWVNDKLDFNDLKNDSNGDKARLLNADDLENIGYIFDNTTGSYYTNDTALQNAMIANGSYWTMIGNSYNIYSSSSNIFSKVYTFDFGRIRPVINLKKKSID